MARPQRKGAERSRERRGRLATLAMALFPLLVAGGAMAPGFVQLLAVAASSGKDDGPPALRPVTPFAHRPLLVPRDFSAGFVPELLDLEQLFRDTDFRSAAVEQRIGRVASFPRSHADLIAIDDVAAAVFPVAFKDVLAQSFGKPNLGDPLPVACGTLHASNCVRDDDFMNGPLFPPGVGPPVPIPEPGSGALLGLGLAALGRHRRRAASRRRAETGSARTPA